MRIQRLGQVSAQPRSSVPTFERGRAGPTLDVSITGPTLDIFPGAGGAPSILQPGDPSGLRVIEPEDVGAGGFPGGGVIDPQDVGLSEFFGEQPEVSFWEKNRNKILVGGGLVAAGAAAWLILRK